MEVSMAKNHAWSETFTTFIYHIYHFQGKCFTPCMIFAKLTSISKLQFSLPPNSIFAPLEISCRSRNLTVVAHILWIKKEASYSFTCNRIIVRVKVKTFVFREILYSLIWKCLLIGKRPAKSSDSCTDTTSSFLWTQVIITICLFALWMIQLYMMERGRMHIYPQRND